MAAVAVEEMEAVEAVEAVAPATAISRLCSNVYYVCSCKRSPLLPHSTV